MKTQNKTINIDIEFRIGKLNEKIGVAILNEEAREFVGEKPCCNKCSNMLHMPIYICETDRWRWFCKHCEKSTKPLCSFDKRNPEKQIQEHRHFCIKKIEYTNDK